jgi:hypothetical protein
MIAAQMGVEAVSDRTLLLCTTTLERKKEEHLALDPQRLKAIEGEARANQTSYAWSLLSQMAAAIMALFNLVWGGSLIARGATVGGSLLVAAGCLTIANSVLSAGGGWDYLAKLLSDNEKTQEWAKATLPIVIALMTLGLNAAAISNIGHVMNAREIMAQLTFASTIFGEVTTVGKAYGQFQVDKAKVASTKVEKDDHFSKSQLETATKIVETLQKAFKQITDEISRGLQKSIRRPLWN